MLEITSACYTHYLNEKHTALHPVCDDAFYDSYRDPFYLRLYEWLMAKHAERTNAPYENRPGKLPGPVRMLFCVPQKFTPPG